MSADPGTEAPGYFRGAPPALILQASSGYGVGRIWGPFLVVRIFRGGMGQGAADFGRWVGGVLVEGKGRFLDSGDDSLSRIIPLRSE
jgi:hypothetical protein